MMSTQKFASSGKVFFKSQLSQNNLTKFFRIKLKITKCYRAINGKNWTNLLATPATAKNVNKGLDKLNTVKQQNALHQ